MIAGMGLDGGMGCDRAGRTLLHSRTAQQKVLSAMGAQHGELPGQVLPGPRWCPHLLRQVQGTFPDTPPLNRLQLWSSWETSGAEFPILVWSHRPRREALGPGTGSLGSSGYWGP